MSQIAKKLHFDTTLIEDIVRNQCQIVKEVDSSNNQDSESPSVMSSGESDPDAREEKKLKQVEQPITFTITPKQQETKCYFQVTQNKSQWFASSDNKRQHTNTSFAESDLLTQISGQEQSLSNLNKDLNIIDGYSYLGQQELYQQQLILQNQFLGKKFSTSQQTLKKKLIPLGYTNNSFSHDFQTQDPRNQTQLDFQQPQLITYTPFQQQQVKRRQFAPQPEISRYQIDIRNIENDGRTTLMIRNIPNKYSQVLLMEDINQSHLNKYDFIYLPIDFTNKCNVGYAFINFLDVRYIKDFYLSYHGQRWKMFNSEKICQITYARIQGAQELEKHFQFSSIINLKVKIIYSIIIGQQNETCIYKQDRKYNLETKKIPC